MIKNFTIGDRIRQLREAKSLSVRRLASLVNCSHSHLLDVEKGKKQLSPSLLEVVAKALSTSATFLLTGEDKDASAAIQKLAQLVELRGDRDNLETLREILARLRYLTIMQQEQLLKIKAQLLKVYEAQAQAGNVPEPTKTQLNMLERDIKQTAAYLRALDRYSETNR